MRILTIFIDMIRANRLALFNNKIKEETPLDKMFKELGGTIYKNCFSEAPDTPRGMATYYSGLPPYKNGCNTRLKWPQYFLRDDISTIFDLFTENGYKIDCFSSPKERDTGLFPKHIANLKIHNNDYDLEKFTLNLKLEDKHFVFISIPDFHWAFDDLGYSTNGEYNSYLIVENVWNIIFKNLDKNDFDDIFIFSDHGFKLMIERKLEDKLFLLNDDRSNNILIHRKKNQNNIIKNNKLCSLSDFYATYADLLNSNISTSKNSISLFSNKEKEFIVLEDHLNFMPSVNQNIEIWAVVDKNNLYIRSLEKAILIDRKSGIKKENIINEYDEILKENSSFKEYLDEYEKIFRYRDNILKKDVYMNGKKRVTKNKFFVYLDYLKDFFIYKKGDI